MPLYEYKCNVCGSVFEVIQKFSDEPLKVHENCGGAVQRLISPSALHFKGSGWYVTDYARKSGGTSPSNGGAKKDATPAKEEKPAAKKESSSASSSTPAPPK